MKKRVKKQLDSSRLTKESYHRDLFLVLTWPIVASFLAIILSVDYFWSIILFLGIPVAYLSYRNQKYIKKIALFSAVLGIPLAIIYDYVMESTGSWFTTTSLFGPIRLFDYIMIDDLIWLFLWVYFVAMFYEAFLDKKVTPKLYKPNLKYLVILMFLALIAFVWAYFFSPTLLQVNFFYTKISILIGVIPIALILFKLPFLISRFIKVGTYFFLHALIYEVTALNLNLWTFPAKDQFIGFVSILGTSFPLEELFFWMILGSLTVITYYEFFDDDLK